MRTRITLKALSVFVALCFAPKLTAQITPNKIIVDGASLYNEDGEKLNEEQIKDLSSFGFDYQRYNHLKQWRTVSIVSYWTGGVLIAAGGFIGRTGEKATEFFSLSLAGSALAVFGVLKKNQCERQILNIVKGLSDSTQLSFSPSGVGLVYYF